MLEQNGGIAMARKVFERAVRKINPERYEQRLSVWLAFLNLEHSYGNERDTFNSILRKALDANDKLRVYTQLIIMYRQSKDHRELEMLFASLVKKYKSHYPFWEQYLQWA